MLILAGYVMLADFVNLRNAQESEQAPAPIEALALPQPWGGYGWRALARLAGNAARIDPATAKTVLTDASSRYPLDAVQWLDLARIHARDEDARQVDDYLARAGAVQPFERRSLWAAAQVALQTGNASLAERQLRQWLRLYPRDTGQALFIGKRWIDEPGTLLDRMLPEGREYLAEAMEVARRQTDIPLAEAVWARLAPKPGLDDPLFLNFVELLLQTGEVARAVELWTDRDAGFQPGRLVNGDFARPVGPPLALNWRINRPPPGVRLERDTTEAFVGPASLRLQFNGKENVNLGEPWIRIPVDPGQHYRLSGAWRADALTTRSLPYWYLTAESADLRERIPAPGGNFGWERWQVDFQVPEEVRLIRLQLRRDRTNAFDRNIAGTLWLDDFRLEPIAAPQTLQSAISEALGRAASVKDTVSGFRVPVSGERRDGAMEEPGESPVGAASSREDSAQDAPPTADIGEQEEQRVGRGGIPDGGNPPKKQADRDDSLARQAPTEGASLRRFVNSSFRKDPTTKQPTTNNQQPTSEPANQPTSEPDTGVGAGRAGEDRGPGTRIAANETETADSDAPARKPSTVNRQPAPQALEPVNRQPGPEAQ